MQPLWLFDPEDFSPVEESQPELILAVLALAVRYSTHEFFEGQTQTMSQRYAESTRKYIMDQIAEGTVQLSTIQSLCLLALANFVASDTRLAWIHINLATSLCQSASFDIPSSTRSDYCPVIDECSAKECLQVNSRQKSRASQGFVHHWKPENSRTSESEQHFDATSKNPLPSICIQPRDRGAHRYRSCVAPQFSRGVS